MDLLAAPIHEGPGRIGGESSQDRQSPATIWKTEEAQIRALFVVSRAEAVKAAIGITDPLVEVGAEAGSRANAAARRVETAKKAEITTEIIATKTRMAKFIPFLTAGTTTSPKSRSTTGARPIPPEHLLRGRVRPAAETITGVTSRTTTSASNFNGWSKHSPDTGTPTRT